MNRAVILLAFLAPAAAAGAEIPDEAAKIKALKLGYVLNGNSMVRDPSLGSLDLSGLALGLVDLSGSPSESAMPKQDRLPPAPEPKKNLR